MIPAHEFRVPIDPVQGARHDVLLCRVDRPGEGFHPIGHPIRLHSRSRRRSSRCLHHFVGYPAKEEGIGLCDVLGRVAMQLFVRGYCTMITTPVQCDVDGIAKRWPDGRSHSWRDARAVNARSAIDGSFLMEAAFETICIERRSICTN